ncbi:MAG: uroporphyrinogen decarboxylase family protein [Candidatus Polarisedimenticolia bacterium]|nr:hypothetical protein [bacterium]
MTGAERVAAALAGAPHDRTPVAPLLGLYGAALTGAPLADHYGDAAVYAAGQSAVADLFDPDVVFAPFAFALLGAAFGGEATPLADRAPKLERPALSGPAALAAWRPPLLDVEPRLLFHREAVRRMAEDHRGRRVVAAAIPGPFDLPALLFGVDGWLETLLFDPAAARDALAATSAFFVAYADALLGDGADCVVATCGLIGPRVLPRRFAAHLAAELAPSSFGRVAGPILVHHADGPFLAHADLVLAARAVVGAVLAPDDDPTRVRGVLGPKRLLASGPAGPRLGSRPPAEIADECAALVERHGAGGRFLLCTTSAEVPLDAPRAAVAALAVGAARGAAPA